MTIIQVAATVLTAANGFRRTGIFLPNRDFQPGDFDVSEATDFPEPELRASGSHKEIAIHFPAKLCQPNSATEQRPSVRKRTLVGPYVRIQITKFLLYQCRHQYLKQKYMT